MRLVIRKAEPGDAAVMADIHCRSWNAAYPGLLPDDCIAARNAIRPAMWEHILSGDHDTFLALHEDIPAGLLALFSPGRDSDAPGAGEVGALYLAPEFQGLGIGRDTMAFALKTLRGRGHDAAVVWVLADNARARLFYERAGFVRDGAAKEFLPGTGIMEIRYRAGL